MIPRLSPTPFATALAPASGPSRARLGALVLLLLLAVGVSLASNRMRTATERAAPLPPRLAAPAAAPDAAGACVPTSTEALRLEPVAVNLRRPVLATAPSGDPRLFIVEQEGTIRLLRQGRMQQEAFLDLRRDVTLNNAEQGLLGLAFHPGFAANGRLFVHYSDARTGATVVAEHTVEADNPDRAQPSGRRLLRVAQPWGNHNGGHLAFGPDGYLYVGLGDGGSGGDPRGNAQDPSTLLGGMLRLDVDGDEPYAIPPDNPFVGVRGARPELWAIGLRNPWRYSFDPATGDLFIADVGQRAVEEIDLQPAGSRGGENYGWVVHEGSACYRDNPECGGTRFVAPLVEEVAAPPCNSITGGFVYRGACLPDLAGRYFYSDYCQDYVRSFVLRDGQVADARDWTHALDPDGSLLEGVSSFGVDGAGELLVVSHRNGVVYRLVAAP